MAAPNPEFSREQFLNKPLPSSAESERVILGAILLDNQLISQAVEVLDPSDFYSPFHRQVFKAMLDLFEKADRIDPILIGEELKKEGSIDSVGGIAAITNLTYGLPHFSDINDYVKVVKEKSITRNLIKVCNQITSEALAEEEDAEVILDHAEQMIFALADEKTRQGFAHVKPVAEEVVTKVQEFAKGDTHALTGLATGFSDLDQMTSGLQRTDLIIVAARPSMGKTALCLTLAQNAAIIDNAVVALFSLEMSKEQLVMRMLSSEARVDAHRFRTGHLIRDEWGRLAQAIGTLSDSRIYVDDTPGISVLQMRAKARRLAAETKQLDLIVIDYMQLMSGSGRAESRQQEVSKISRELKGLAKELNVPVVALSQLSRAPEARNPPRPMLSDLRESGCLAGESLVTLADTGECIPIKNLVGKKNFNIWALNETTKKIEKAKVTNAFATGRKRVFRIKTRLGREIKATANHKFYTFDGWKRLDQLKAGEKLSLPRKIKNQTTQSISDEELALLAHLIGDGCTLPRHSIQYTTKEIDLAELVASLANKIFGNDLIPKIKKERNWYQVYLTSARNLTHNVRNPISEWLRNLKVWGLRSHQKFIPEKVFTQPEKAISVFLKHLWVTDGSIKLVGGKRPKPSIYYATSSKKLAKGVQTLLLRVGINARFSEIPQGKKGRTQFHVIVSGKQDLKTFILKIGTVGKYKTASLKEIERFIKKRVENTNRDIIPKNAWRRFVVPAMQNSKITTREMMAQADMAYCGTSLYKSNLSRDRALRFAKIVKSEKLEKLAQSDIYWDSIVSIEEAGETEVFDLTVEKHANFESNGIIVHNSIEQDADVVAFIYREEYYKPSDENAGIAEILVSKQRNGPTGTVKLAFLKEFTRFENYFGE